MPAPTRWAASAQTAKRSSTTSPLARLAFEEQRCLATPYPFANDGSRVAWFERPEREPSYAAHEDYRCTVTVLSGLPGSGKDTWIAANRADLPVVSLDAIRTELGAPGSGKQGRVIQAAQEAARQHLRAGRDFVWNATNISRQVRARVLRLMRDYGARVEIVYLEVRPDDLIARNASQAAALPVDALSQMIAKLEPPQYWEAHDVRWIVPDD